MKSSQTQRRVALAMFSALLLSIAALATTAVLQPFQPWCGAPAGRCQPALLAALAPALTLAACIARLAAHRFLTPQDIDGSGLTEGSEQARLLQAILQNTLEQMVLALPVYAAWGAFAPPRYAGLVLTAALLFLCGRILFVAGYQRGAAGRAFGFALTFYPTLILLVGALYFCIAKV